MAAFMASNLCQTPGEFHLLRRATTTRETPLSKIIHITRDNSRRSEPVSGRAWLMVRTTDGFEDVAPDAVDESSEKALERTTRPADDPSPHWYLPEGTLERLNIPTSLVFTTKFVSSLVPRTPSTPDHTHVTEVFATVVPSSDTTFPKAFADPISAKFAETDSPDAIVTTAEPSRFPSRSNAEESPFALADNRETV